MELVISIALFTIVIAMIGSFISSGLRISSETEKRVVLESHYGHIALFLERNIEDKSSVYEVRGSRDPNTTSSNMTEESGRIYLSSVKFKFEEDLKRSIGEKEENDGFGLYVSDSKSKGYRTISYDKNFRSSKGYMQCGNYMDEVIVEPVPRGASFRDSRGIKFIFQNRVGKTVTEFQKTIYFKNWRERNGQR